MLEVFALEEWSHLISRFQAPVVQYCFVAAFDLGLECKPLKLGVWVLDRLVVLTLVVLVLHLLVLLIMHKVTKSTDNLSTGEHIVVVLLDGID